MKIEFIPFLQIELQPGFNTRYEYGDLEELSRSIIERGLEIPLVLTKAPRGVKYFLVGGHRRYAAIKMAHEAKVVNGFDFTKIPCDVREEYHEKDMIADIIIHNSGKPLLPLEEAETFKRLLEKCGSSVHEIARITGKKKPHINNYLKLAYAGEKIKQLVKEGTITASTAIQIITLHPEDEEAQLDELSGAMDTAIKEGAKKVSSSHVGKIREKKPLPKFKMLVDKIAVENVASKNKVTPEVNEAIKIINELLFDWLPANEAYKRLLQIKPTTKTKSK